MTLSKGENLRAAAPRTLGPVRCADGSVQWRVWAPRCERLDMVLWDGVVLGQSLNVSRALPMHPAEPGYFTFNLPQAPHGLRYAFRLPDGGEFPDPASLWQPDGVHRPSAYYDPQSFVWSDGLWRGMAMSDMVIYELHVGAFSAAGDFEGVIARLPELKELGVTAIEIMPVAEFPGRRNWGYDGVHLFAAHHGYGGPAGLQRLVDAAHHWQLAVVLDVVYNHLGPEGNYLSRFGPYFTQRYHTPWGAAVNFDGPGSDGVRQFIIENALMWVREFHIDALRLDATHEIYDQSPRNIHAELQAAVQGEAQQSDRRINVIAENDRNDPRFVRDPARGGYDLDGVWSDDFHHSVHALLTGERTAYYLDFGAPEQLAKAYRDAFVFDGQYSPYHRRRQGAPIGDLDRRKFVICVQNHDQVGNRPSGNRLASQLPPAALRLMAGLLLISPDVPMLFMGEEYGEQRQFPFFCSFEDAGLIEAVRRGRREMFAEVHDLPDPQAVETFACAKLAWSWPAGSWQAGLRRLYQDLLRARREWPPLAAGEPTRAEAIAPASSAGGLLVIERGSPGALIALANLGGRPEAVSADRLRGLRPRLTTEAARYAGARSDNDTWDELMPYEMAIFVEEGRSG